MTIEADTLAKRFGIPGDSIDISCAYMRKSVDKEFSDKAKLTRAIYEAQSMDERNILARASREGKILEPSAKFDSNNKAIRVRNSASMLGFSHRVNPKLVSNMKAKMNPQNNSITAVHARN
jgi:hypothetical protein